MIKIISLHIYPVKSLAGIQISKARLLPEGFEFDRNWMLVDESGKFITQRKIHKLALFRTSISDGELLVEFENKSCRIPVSGVSDSRKNVEIWNDNTAAVLENETVSNWFGEILEDKIGGKAFLVKADKSNLRRIDSKYPHGEKSAVRFADAFPYLIASSSSLRELNNSLGKKGLAPLPMNRFRPNIVIDGLPPFEENNIKTLAEKNGRYKLSLAKPCGRCVITTVDQSAGLVSNKNEPLKTLSREFRIPKKRGAFFGYNALPAEGAGNFVNVGDELEII